jgi:lipase chaperone LimK
LKQQYINKSRKEVAALAGEEVADRLEALTAQDKFNQAVEKLQDIFVSLIDGPIGQLLDLLAQELTQHNGKLRYIW